MDGNAAGEVPQRFDDDGRLKRTGTVWTASAHIITAVIGSGVLSLSWAMAQLGWIAGPIALFLFSLVTCYTSCLLTDCYRHGDSVSGQRNNTYMDAVQKNLGGFQVKFCGLIQYLNLVGVAIGYTIAASISMTAIKRSSCFHEKGHENPCEVSGILYTVLFGIVQIFFSQIPGLGEVSWLSGLAALMSVTYSSIGFGLLIAKVAESKKIMGSLTGISIGMVTQAEKIWNTFHALGLIAFAYSHSLILIEIQDTIKSPPAENKTMKRVIFISILTTTIFYMLCGCFGYATFGDLAPKDLLTGFGFYNPYWLVDIANVAIVIHLVGAYHIYCQPLFAFVESTTTKYFPQSNFINNNINIPIPIIRYKPYQLNLFRLVWRSSFVCMTTVVAMLMPFFEDVAGILGAVGFWPLTVYFPMKMYIAQKKIPKASTRWVSLQILSATCLIISVCAAVGSFAALVQDMKIYKPFNAMN